MQINEEDLNELNASYAMRNELPQITRKSCSKDLYEDNKAASDA